MDKTLVIVAHPKLGSSKINKRWVEELKEHPDKIILQFPFYWFNCPPFVKKWIDDVLAHGWAYGKNSGYKLAGKKIALAITAGILEEDYSATGRYEYTLKELTAPFEITFKYVKADYRPHYAFYGEEHNPTEEDIDKNAKNYIDFIENLSN